MPKAGKRSPSAGAWLARLALVLVLLDLAAWGIHVQWRRAALARLEPVVEQIDRLGGEIAADDGWLAVNERLLQQYGQPDRFAQRAMTRGRRVTAHDALVDSYNQQLDRLYKRFYIALRPPPDPHYRQRIVP